MNKEIWVQEVAERSGRRRANRIDRISQMGESGEGSFCVGMVTQHGGGGDGGGVRKEGRAKTLLEYGMRRREAFASNREGFLCGKSAGMLLSLSLDCLSLSSALFLWNQLWRECVIRCSRRETGTD